MRYSQMRSAAPRRPGQARACQEHRAAAASRPRRGLRSAFTLVETLIVVVILAILASLVVPKLGNANEDTAEAAVRRHLQIIRHQVAYYRTQNNGAEPDLVGNQWTELVSAGSEFLTHPPKNPLNNRVNVVDDAANGPAGWVWRPGPGGTSQIYATDETALAEWVE